jgi:hypothetical protein
MVVKYPDSKSETLPDGRPSELPPMNADLDARLAERIALCKQERRSYEIWLSRLTPANFVLLGLGGVLSLIAGLSIVTEAKLIDPKVAGWMALIGAVLSGLHSRLKCDPHQAECRRLAAQFAELQTEYERLELELDEAARREQLLSLEHKLATVRAGRTARPSNVSIERARHEIEINA